MVAEAVTKYRHALVRDVLALGYRAGDMFTTLSFADMISIVVASPPGSSLRYWMDQGWSRTDHLLANMAEADADVAHLKAPYERPGLEDRAAGNKIFGADSMTWEEMDAREAQRAQTPHGTSRVKVWGAGD